MPAVNFRRAVKQRTVLEIEVPDWSAFDQPIAGGKPFVLWRVGYQSLLHHWLDYAINTDVQFLRIFCPGKPHLVRQAMEEATLWPIDWELIPSRYSGGRQQALPVIGLPPVPVENDDKAKSKPSTAKGEEATAIPEFENQWDLLDYWFALERECFNRLHFEGKTEDLELWIGRFSHVDPSAKLHFPLWIGDNVYIGPNTEIGPYASIGHSSVVEGNSRVVHSKIGANTFLGAHTHLEGAYLDGNRLISRRHRSAVTMNDAFVATALRRVRQHRKPGKRERCYALGYWLTLLAKMARRRLAFWRKPETAPFWESRVPQLLEVVRGQRLLFGILDRSPEAIAAHDEEWREILEAETPGVFSYADSVGCHQAEVGMEPIHAVYQATQPRRRMEELCRKYLHELISDAIVEIDLPEDPDSEPTSDPEPS